MSRWVVGFFAVILCVVFAYGSIPDASARSRLPTICVQARNSYNSSKRYTRSTVKLLRSFKQSWRKAFRVKARSKRTFSRAIRVYRFSSTKYNSLRTYLSRKGFSISKSLSLSALLRQKGFSLRGRRWRLPRLPNRRAPRARRRGSRKPPINFRKVRRTLTKVKFSKRILTRSLRLSRRAIKLLLNAKKLGVRARSQLVTARRKLKKTLSLIRRCRAELRKQRRRRRRRPRKRTSLPVYKNSRYCGANHSTFGVQVFCAPCDPMRSSCENSCFGFAAWGQMEQDTQNQEGELTSSERSSGAGNGGAFFEIDMKTTEARNEETNASNGVNDTSSQASSLSF